MLGTIDGASPPAWTTEAEFLSRQCNRCGACCEGFWLPSIFDLTDALMWAFHDCARGDLAGAVRWLALMRQQQRHNPGNVTATFELRPCEAADQPLHANKRRQAEWLLDLEPVAAPRAGHDLYRCTRLAYDWYAHIIPVKRRPLAEEASIKASFIDEAQAG